MRVHRSMLVESRRHHQAWVGMSIGYVGLLALLLVSSVPGAGGLETLQPAEKEPPTAKVEVGKPAPDFSIMDQDGYLHNLSYYRGKIVVLEWFNPECPEVRQAHMEGPLKVLANRIHRDEDKVWLAVNSTESGLPGAGTAANRIARQQFGLEFPILGDEKGQMARAYGAVKAPQVFVIDREGILRYVGAIDDDPGLKKSKDGQPVLRYLDDAVKAVASGTEVTTPKTKAYGCDIARSKG